MIQWFSEMAQVLGHSPWLQGGLAALSTLILEDPTTVGAGLLVAQGKMAWRTAFLGLSIGIAGGDFLLYLLGRYAQGHLLRWGWVHSRSLDVAGKWFHRNVLLAMLTSRFLPGMRFPTYIAAGVVQVNPLTFLLIAVSATLAWTLLLLSLTVHFGTVVLARMGDWKLPIGLALVVLVAGGQWLAARHRKQALESEPTTVPIASIFEFWPPWLFYIPLVLYIGRLALRHRHLTLPLLANPAIYMGGFIGESKGQILSLVGEEQRRWISPWIRWPQGGPLHSKGRVYLLNHLADSGIDFPLVAKPDVGHRGTGVQVIPNRDALWDYLRSFPEDDAIILQQKVDYHREAGIFYIRKPTEAHGRLFSITLKRFPTVTGDGERSLRQLILADPRARKLKTTYFKRLKSRLAEIPNASEVIPLVFSGNHCQGAIFKNGWHLRTPALAHRIDEIARSMDGFYFGRFDLRYATDEALMRGDDFQIVEINGASAEATHIWDARCTLKEAYRVLFEQYSLLFAIGAANYRRGTPLFPLRRFFSEWMRYNLRRAGYPETH